MIPNIKEIILKFLEPLEYERKWRKDLDWHIYNIEYQTKDGGYPMPKPMHENELEVFNEEE